VAKYTSYDVKEELAVSQATSPLNTLDVLSLSEVAYCASLSISYGLTTRL